MSACSSDASDDDEYSDWVEEDETPARSLFDEQTFKTAQEALDHDAAVHKVDLLALARRLELEFFGVVKLINWIRLERPKPEFVLQLDPEQAAKTLESDVLLKPALEDDKLLQLDWDDLVGTLPKSAEQSEVERLREQVAELTEAVASLRQMLYERLTDDSPDASNAGATNRTDASTSRKPGEHPDRIDRPYFATYAENEIHEIMLRDKIRTESYRDFISNPTLFRDKVVLDVGCGSGILSMFAARAGAKHVYAVDASDIAAKAKLNVYDNGLQDRITVIQCKVEDIQLPVAHVDIIVSEWMGYALLYESMLDSVLVARDRFLAPGGLLAPSQCSLFLAGLESDAAVDSALNFWDEVYGFKMTAMKEIHTEEALIEHVASTSLVTRPSRFIDVCLHQVNTQDLECVDGSFELVWAKDATVRALVLWFDSIFTVDGRLVAEGERLAANGELSFSTGPGSQAESTHWKQTVLVLKKPLAGQQGHTVRGQIKLRKEADNRRALDIEVHMQDGDAQRAQLWQLK